MVNKSGRSGDEDDSQDPDEWETLEVPNNHNGNDVSSTATSAALENKDTGRMPYEAINPPPSSELRQRLNKHTYDRCSTSSTSSKTSASHLTQPYRRIREDETTNHVPSRRGATTRPQQHPLQHFVSHFGYYLCYEFWNRDWNIRLAVVFVVLGFLFQMIHWSFWYILYPEQILWYGLTILLALGIPMAILQHQKPMIIQQFIQHMNGTRTSSVESWWVEIVDVLQPQHLQFCTLLCLYVVPTLVEIRTLHFLSNIVSSGISAMVIFTCYLLLSVIAYFSRQSPKAQMVFDLFRYSPRACTQMGLYILYGIALWIVCTKHPEWRHVPQLAARFLVATAVILWKTSATATTEGYGSEIVQSALRCTMRDSLKQVNESVPQDEMLQLAMLRWIIDYWTSSSTTTTTPNSGDNTGNRNDSTNPRSNNPNVARRTARNTSSTLHNHRDIDWTELWSMLQTTTIQMASEVNSFQVAEENANMGTRGAEATSEIPAEVPPHPDTTFQPGRQRSQQPLAAANNSSSSNHHARPTEQTNTSSVQDLQSMLASMDIDDRAKPAVRAYRQAVEALPPSRQTAMVLACMRQCPAILLVMLYILVGVWYQMPIAAIALLFPFTAVECRRLHLWYMSVILHSSETLEENGSSTGICSSAEPMTLLLMDERYYLLSRLPPLLIVWQNISASVSALEVGLTAARCVQTTVVAVDFASNVMSLVDFGYKVAEHGWLHGLSLVAYELLHLHRTSSDFDNFTSLFQEERTLRGAKYTGAAVSAVRNSQKITRNIQALMEEEDRLVGPLLAFIPALIGYGWLWGRENEDHCSDQIRKKSSVVIEEIHDEPENMSASSLSEQLPDLHNNGPEGSSETTQEQSVTPVQSGEVEVETAHSSEDTSEQISSIANSKDLTTELTQRKENGILTNREDVKDPQDDDYEPIYISNINQTQPKLTTEVDLPNLSTAEPGKESQMVKNLLFLSENAILDPDDDDSFEQLYSYDKDPQEANGESESLPMQVAESPSDPCAQHPNEIDEQGDNLLLKIGGGLAIFGAVVAGGIALANANNRDDPRKECRDKKSHDCIT